jgi:hypothetical protein
VTIQKLIDAHGIHTSHHLETSLQLIVLLISQTERTTNPKLIYLGSMRPMKPGMIGFIQIDAVTQTSFVRNRSETSPDYFSSSNETKVAFDSSEPAENAGARIDQK